MNFENPNLEKVNKEEIDPKAIHDQILKFLDGQKELELSFDFADLEKMEDRELMSLKLKMVGFIDGSKEILSVDRESLHKKDEKVGESYDMFKYNVATLKYRYLTKLVEEMKKRELEVEDDILDGAEEEYNEKSKLVDEFLHPEKNESES